jgi:hypothetical protein
MRHETALAVAVVLAALVPLGAAAAGTGAVAQADGTNATDGNATVSPGERLSGVVGVQGAELEGEVERRAFGLQVARAASEDARAAVVAERVADLRERVGSLEQRTEALAAARANGSLSEGAYRARVAELAAQSRTVEALANRTGEVASGLPAEALEARGVDTAALAELRQSARNLTGPEVAALARSVAGPGVGGPMAASPPGVGGPTAGTTTGTPDGEGSTPGDTATDVPDGAGMTPDGNTTGGNATASGAGGQ